MQTHTQTLPKSSLKSTISFLGTLLLGVAFTLAVIATQYFLPHRPDPVFIHPAAVVPTEVYAPERPNPPVYPHPSQAHASQTPSWSKDASRPMSSYGQAVDPDVDPALGRGDFGQACPLPPANAILHTACGLALTPDQAATVVRTRLLLGGRKDLETGTPVSEDNRRWIDVPVQTASGDTMTTYRVSRSTGTLDGVR